MSRNDVLVTTEWAELNVDNPNVVFVEVDEGAMGYDAGHIEGAVELDWKADLQDPVRRDFVNQDQFSELLSVRGIAGDDTVDLYGGNNNWSAADGYWYFKLYGHEKVKQLVGGRKKWELDGRPFSTEAVTRRVTQSQLSHSTTASARFATRCWRPSATRTRLTCGLRTSSPARSSRRRTCRRNRRNVAATFPGP